MITENDIISKVLLSIDLFKGNIENLRNAIIHGEYSPRTNPNYSGGLIWKCLCITNTLKIRHWKSRLNESRVVYSELISRQDMVIPWWELEKDSIYYSPKEIISKSLKHSKFKISLGQSNADKKDLLANSYKVLDPLNDPEEFSENKSDENFDLELLKIIILDVDRLFAGEKFFNSEGEKAKSFKKDIIQFLFIWSKCNYSIGYKQGLHEIAGLIYLSIHHEVTPPIVSQVHSEDDTSILELYNKDYLLHDLFTIFSKFMIQSKFINCFYESESHLWASIENLNSELIKVDQIIHYNLVCKLKLETQIWGIRYLRLLLMREINNLEVTCLLWEKLLAVLGSDAASSLPDLLNFIIICMLIKIKPNLIASDYSEALSLLLHYPNDFFNNSFKKYGFFQELFDEAFKLYSARHNDLQLYETGLKINELWNPTLKIALSFGGRTQSNSPSRGQSQSSSHTDKSADPQKKEKIAFEKFRLEQRLKKKAASMLKSKP